jgi:methionine sulfoxide reductase heme-binding subunit
VFDQVLWFAARGAGIVSLLMLTASAAFGLVTVTRFQAAGWPRFFNYEMHRRVSLLSVAFLATHVVAAILDPYLKLGLAGLVPFAAAWKPVPLALGIVAGYLFIALIATSLLRRHLGQRAWRAIHWTSYAMWPMALLHTVTAGTDALTPWMLAVEAIALAVIAGAATWRWVDRGATMMLGSRSLAR